MTALPTTCNPRCALSRDVEPGQWWSLRGRLPALLARPLLQEILYAIFPESCPSKGQTTFYSNLSEWGLLGLGCSAGE